MRARAEIVEGKTNDTIVITELPYQVSPNSVFTKIKELLRDKELDGISDINDYSAAEKPILRHSTFRFPERNKKRSFH